MGKVLVLIIGLWVVLAACSGSNAQAELKERISHVEDSLTKVSQNLAVGEQMSSSDHKKLLDLLEEYYKGYPEDKYAPECLDKMHMIYSGRGEYELSSTYADILLNKYPDYINRAMILESQASTYDFFIKPRDTVKIRYYYEKLLTEFPDLPKEKIEGINDRLSHLDRSLEDIILNNE